MGFPAVLPKPSGLLQSIHNDLDRYETQGVARLADGRSPGPPPRLTPAMEVCVQEWLAEPRLWNGALLSEALLERFGVTMSRDAMRVWLRALGYSWRLFLGFGELGREQ